MKIKSHFLCLILITLTHVVYGQKFRTTEQFQAYFLDNEETLDVIEGIWYVHMTAQVNDTREKRTPYTVAIIKEDKPFTYSEYLLKDGYYEPMEGSKKFIYTTNGFQLESYFDDTHKTAYGKTFYIASPHKKFSFTVNVLNILRTRLINQGQRDALTILKKAISNYSYTKLFPLESDLIAYNQKHTETKKNTPQSGTGFAISSDGLIVTNYHVIEGAQTIKVRGVNGDFNKTLNAKVMVSDKNNDLALLKIDDSNYSNLGTIPYVIKTNLSSVGENIFVLGYPLRASMGDEIKLTNGIISSKAGFQGDITSYQVSAPVQPGNSGGPLFDNNGYLVGIINAKHMKADNAAYAVKTSYLKILIEALDETPKLPIFNSLKGKPLPTQVKLAKQFVYIIETN